MTPERLQYEVDQWHRAQGPARKPDYWPPEATLCDIPQHHELKKDTVKLAGQKVDLTVHYCGKCALSVVEPTVKDKGGKG